jgi:hypothetical protein
VKIKPLKLVIILIFVAVFATLCPLIVRELRKAEAGLLIIKDCREPYASIEKCPNGDYVIGRRGLVTINSAIVCDRFGFRITKGFKITDGLSNQTLQPDEPTVIYFFRKIFNLKIGCSEDISEKLCSKRNLY